MSDLKAQLRSDLTASMKARDTLRTGTLRMALAAIMTEEVAGATARELSDADVQVVLTREVRKRKESAEVFDGAGRTELADKERAESAVLVAYLPSQLSDAEVSSLVEQAVADVTAESGTRPTTRQMGVVIKAVQASSAGRADGARISAAVKVALSGS